MDDYDALDAQDRSDEIMRDIRDRMSPHTTPKGDKMEVQYTLNTADDGTQFLSVFLVGGNRPPATTDSTNPDFAEILEMVENDDPTALDMIDAATAALNKFEPLSERVTMNRGRLFFDGDQVHSSLADQVRRFLKDGVEDWKPLVRFLELVKMNPEPHSQEMLFDWTAKEDLTITADGYVVGYKSVNKADGGGYLSIHTGTAFVNGERFEDQQIPQQVGDTVTMPRSAVVHNPREDCSVGLHVGTYSYADRFDGNVLLEVKVNPRDVVSVPQYDANKMRVCRYEIVGEVKEKYTTPVRPTTTKRGKVTVKDQIVKLLEADSGSEFSAEQIASTLGANVKTVRSILPKLVREKRIVLTSSDPVNFYGSQEAA